MHHLQFALISGEFSDLFPSRLRIQALNVSYSVKRPGVAHVPRVVSSLVRGGRGLGFGSKSAIGECEMPEPVLLLFRVDGDPTEPLLQPP